VVSSCSAPADSTARETTLHDAVIALSPAIPSPFP
jgi:hypothetical protein